MSEMETHKGKLVPITNAGDNLEEQAKEICSRLGLEREEYHKTWIECLRDEGYRKVYIHGDTIYEIQDTQLDSYGFTEGTANEDGSINYFISWYNGGASMDEVLDDVMDKTAEARHMIKNWK